MWTGLLNPSKSVVLVFGEAVKTQKRLMYQRNWKLGTDSVHERTTHRHVGLILSTTANNTERTLQATKMIRNTFFSLVGSGLHPSNINPLTIVKTFQSVGVSILDLVPIQITLIRIKLSESDTLCVHT